MTKPVEIDLRLGLSGLEHLELHTADRSSVDLTPHVRALGLRWADGEVPTLVLELPVDPADLVGDVDGHLEAIVQVVAPEPSDPGALVGEWLAALDPAELERGALEGSTMGGVSTGELFLGHLYRLATGTTDPPPFLRPPQPEG